MKKIILFFFISSCIRLFSIEINTYDMQIVKEYETARGASGNYNTLGTQFLRNSGPTPTGPSLGYFNNCLHIIDYHRNRTLELDNGYNFEAKFDYNFHEAVIYQMDEALVGIDNFSTISIVKDNEEISYIDLYDYNINALNTPRSVLFYQNTLFIHDKEGSLLSLVNPGLDNKENRKNLRNQEETIKTINDGEFEGLTTVEENRLFIDGELKTINYKTYIKYYAGINGKEAGNIRGFKYNYDFLEKFRFDQYIGKDELNYQYWGYRGAIMIFNKLGKMVDFFKYDSEKSSTSPVVSSEGDIYFLKHEEDKVTLYEISRQW